MDYTDTTEGRYYPPGVGTTKDENEVHFKFQFLY
jgi:hypothetical protein